MAIVAGALAVVSASSCGPKDPNDGKDTRYNQETVEIMRRVMAADANGVDVGAYIGELTQPMADIAPSGHHIAVEPQPVYAADLRARFPNVRVLQLALGDTSGTVEFVQALDSPARSGFREHDYPTDHERTQKIRVQVARLDSLVTTDAPIAFIKIDVEGAESMVLRGAMQTITRDRPVIVLEYGQAGQKSYGITPEMMWGLLHNELGMDVSLMRTWLDGGPAFTAEAFTQMATTGGEWMYVAYPRETVAARRRNK